MKIILLILALFTISNGYSATLSTVPTHQSAPTSVDKQLAAQQVADLLLSDPGTLKLALAIVAAAGKSTPDVDATKTPRVSRIEEVEQVFKEKGGNDFKSLAVQNPKIWDSLRSLNLERISDAAWPFLLKRVGELIKGDTAIARFNSLIDNLNTGIQTISSFGG